MRVASAGQLRLESFRLERFGENRDSTVNWKTGCGTNRTGDLQWDYSDD
jgi:hypothetical protein